MALMVTQNALLPPSQSNLVLQLTANKCKDNKRMKSYVFSNGIVFSIIKHIVGFNRDLDPVGPIFQQPFIDKTEEITLKEDGDDRFSLKETISVMEQVSETTAVVRKNTLMGRRDVKSINRTRRYHGFGKLGNFAWDIPSFFQKIKKKSEENKKHKAAEAEYSKISRKGTAVDYKPEISQEDYEDEEETKPIQSSPKKKQRKRGFFQYEGGKKGIPPLVRISEPDHSYRCTKNNSRHGVSS